MTRKLYFLHNQKTAWCQYLPLTGDAKQELIFRQEKVTEFNGQHIWLKPSAMRVVYSDASDMGYGGYLVEHGKLVANGQWSKDEAKQSFTWRELRAVRLVLESFQTLLKNERVQWFSDNQNVVRIVQYGSRVPALQSESLAIFSLSMRNLETDWIPREKNKLADYLSRLVDYDDWMLNPGVFNIIDMAWGPHDVDRFANSVNNQLVWFNSRFWEPGTEAIDAFPCNWVDDNNWLCPPVHLVPRVIRHAENSKAKGTLVIPQWVSFPFWPLLFPDGKNSASFVVDYIELPRCDSLFLPGRSGFNLFKGTPNTPVLALQIDFAEGGRDPVL